MNESTAKDYPHYIINSALILLIVIGLALSTGLTKALSITLQINSLFLKSAIMPILFVGYIITIYLISKKTQKNKKTNLKQEIVRNFPVFIPFLLFLLIPIYLPLKSRIIQDYFSYYTQTQKGNISHIFFIFFLSLTISYFIYSLKNKGIPHTFKHLPQAKKFGLFVIITILILIYTTSACFFAIWHYLIFKTHEDFGVFLQLFYITSHKLGFFETSLSNYPESLSIFADHNAPVLFLLYPIIFLPHSPYIYIILNFILLTSAAIPLWLIMKEKFNYMERFFIIFGFLMSPYYVYQHLNGLSIEMLSPIVIVCAYLFIRKNRFIPFVITFVLGLMIKEDLAFALILFSLIAWKYKRHKKWIITIVTLSIISIIISFMIVIPHFRQESSVAKLSSEFGQNTDSILSLIIYQFEHPVLTIKKLINPHTLSYIYILLLPGLLILPFFTIESLVMLPAFLINIFLVSWATNITSKHSLVIPGVLFISSIASLEKIKKIFDREWVLHFSIPLLIIATSLASIPIWSYNLDVITPRPYFKSENQAVKLIPDNVSAAVPVSMFSRLGHRIKLTPSMLPNRIAGFEENNDYVLLDEHFPSIDFDYKKEIENMLKSDSEIYQKYDLIYNNKGIYLFRKK